MAGRIADVWEKHSATVLDAPWIARTSSNFTAAVCPVGCSQEYFCEFSRSDDAFFDPKLVYAAISDDIEPL
jgi:hypothetical protein